MQQSRRYNYLDFLLGLTPSMYGGYTPSTPSDWSFATAAAAASIASHNPRTAAHHRFHPADTSCSIPANSSVHNASFLSSATDYPVGDSTATNSCNFSPHRPVNYHSAAFFAENAAYSAALSAKSGAINSNLSGGFNVFPGAVGGSGSKLLDSLNTTSPSGIHGSSFGGSASAFGLHGAGLMHHASGPKHYGDITDRHNDQDSGKYM